MLLGETIGVAIGALRANKLRSFLTMLGVVIGVGAVIAVVALGRGASQSVQARISALGTTLLSVSPGQIFAPGGVSSGTDRAPMTVDDAKALDSAAAAGGAISAVEPEMQKQLQVQYLNTNTNTTVLGTSANYLDVRKYQIATGKMFSEGDNRASKRVAVLGAAIPDNLSVPAQSLIGQNVRIGGFLFEVVGVLASKGNSGGFGNPDDQVLVPITTAQFRLFGNDRLRQIGVLAASEAEIPNAMAEIQRVLRREHRLRVGIPDDFQIRSQADFLNTLGETTQIFTFLLSGIAAVSLLVGGIGIMNIMLVSVTERTREIGVRKALGATPKNILLQFLIEAVVLCLLGGVGGIVFGWLGAVALAKFGNFNTSVAPSSILLAFFFSGFVGILFGVWPARRAANLDPIQSLRYE
ncbi:MAG: multidrug ABC transporter substrate-binding protein [Gemmatimonas sp. 13_1_20CM_3_60_15]|nr:MAG: multidrug ABC transporter substrate-binding protein [Gemmatimonas sp. 13_1_20CM_3_60_15]